MIATADRKGSLAGEWDDAMGGDGGGSTRGGRKLCGESVAASCSKWEAGAKHNRLTDGKEVDSNTGV